MKPRRRGQGNVGKIGGTGNADLGVRGDQLLLGFCWMSGRRLPGEQKEARLEFGERGLLREIHPRVIGPGLLPTRTLSKLLLLSDALFEVGDLCACGIYQLLRLANVQNRTDAMLRERLRQI